jgi:hypothetical protein
MKAIVKSLLAELFPAWVKEEAIQPRRRMDTRRAAARQGTESPKPSFGQRSGHRVNAPVQRNGRGGAQPRP